MTLGITKLALTFGLLASMTLSSCSDINKRITNLENRITYLEQEMKIDLFDADDFELKNKEYNSDLLNEDYKFAIEVFKSVEKIRQSSIFEMDSKAQKIISYQDLGILRSNPPSLYYLLDMGAEWCGPCKMSLPKLSLINEYIKKLNKMTRWDNLVELAVMVSDMDSYHDPEDINRFMRRVKNNGLRYAGSTSDTRLSNGELPLMNVFVKESGTNNYRLITRRNADSIWYTSILIIGNAYTYQIKLKEEDKAQIRSLPVNLDHNLFQRIIFPLAIYPVLLSYVSSDRSYTNINNKLDSAKKHFKGLALKSKELKYRSCVSDPESDLCGFYSAYNEFLTILSTPDKFMDELSTGNFNIDLFQSHQYEGLANAINRIESYFEKLKK